METAATGRLSRKRAQSRRLATEARPVCAASAVCDWSRRREPPGPSSRPPLQRTSSLGEQGALAHAPDSPGHEQRRIDGGARRRQQHLVQEDEADRDDKVEQNDGRDLGRRGLLRLALPGHFGTQRLRAQRWGHSTGVIVRSRAGSRTAPRAAAAQVRSCGRERAQPQPPLRAQLCCTFAGLAMMRERASALPAAGPTAAAAPYLQPAANFAAASHMLPALLRPETEPCCPSPPQASAQRLAAVACGPWRPRRPST